MRRVLQAGFVLCVLAFVVFFMQLYLFIKQPLIPENTQLTYWLQPGHSLQSLASDLEQMGYLHQPLTFTFYARINGMDSRIKAGEYLLAPGTTAKQLLQQLMQGKVLHHQVTFVEGWDFNECLKAL